MARGGMPSPREGRRAGSGIAVDWCRSAPILRVRARGRGVRALPMRCLLPVGMRRLSDRGRGMGIR
jgi:hypothetical protein